MRFVNNFLDSKKLDDLENDSVDDFIVEHFNNRRETPLAKKWFHDYKTHILQSTARLQVIHISKWLIN